MKLYNNEAEIEAVVMGFDSCRTDKSEFTHSSHLTVAVWCLWNMNPVEASKRMRESLIRFLEHHGIDREKYNETLTTFWLRSVIQFINASGSDSLLETTNAVIEAFGNPRLALEYYSPERLWSEEARRRWVPPDIKVF